MPISGGDLLTFMDKYDSNSTKGMASLKRVLPAPIEPELKERIQKLSVDIFKAMDCKGVVRIDYMFDAPSQELYISPRSTPFQVRWPSTSGKPAAFLTPS